MARTGVTREQIFDTADTLVREGQTPTVVAVRKRLGGGSPNTITPWLAEWKEQHKMQHVDELPPLPEAVESAMRQVWGVAWKETQTLLEAEREALNTSRKEVERERAEMLGEIERMDKDLDRVNGEIRIGAEALEVERRSHAQTQAEVKEACAVAAERKKQIENQENEIRMTRHDAQEVGAKMIRLEAELTHSTKDVERERRLRDETGRQVEQLRDHATRLQAELESAKRHAKESKGIADKSGKKVQRLEDSLDKERQAKEKAEKTAADLRVEVASLTERAAQAHGLTGMVKELQMRLADLAEGRHDAKKKASSKAGV